MGWIKNLIFKMLKIKPAGEREIVIQEPLSFQANVLKNKVWYRGELKRDRAVLQTDGTV